MYMSFLDKQPLSVLRVTLASRPRTAAKSRFQIDLELNLPRQGATLSEMTLKQLQQLQQAKML